MSIDLNEVSKLLSQRLDWVIDSDSLKQRERNHNDFFDVTAIDNATQETVEGFVYIDDETIDGFDFDRYLKIVGAFHENEGYKPFITIFKDYKREQTVYKTTLRKYRSEDFTLMWEAKISIYTDASKPIRLSVDCGGINYVEYSTKDIEAYIYNISMSEILEILHVTGTDLYRDNVRIGISKYGVSRRLKVNFRDYILSAILDDEDFCKNYEALAEKMSNELMMKRNTSLFWYSHNGITIFSRKKAVGEKYKIKRDGSFVTLDPLRISVINGAQTITNFNNASEDIKRLIVRADKTITQKKAEQIVNKALSTLKVKTIIINGPADCVGNIALGLNTQIPVGENEQAIALSEIKEINKSIESLGLKIVRNGEDLDEFWMKPQRFVKMYLLIRQKPGVARNLKNNQIETYIREANEYKEESDYFGELLRKVILAEVWWKDNTEFRDANSKGLQYVLSNGCYYYCSYRLKYLDFYKNTSEEVSYEKTFDSFVDIIKELKDSKYRILTSNSFKTDDLYNDIIEKLNEQNPKKEQK